MRFYCHLSILYVGKGMGGVGMYGATDNLSENTFQVSQHLCISLSRIRKLSYKKIIPFLLTFIYL